MHRPSDIHALREDATARLLDSGVREDMVAALFDPERLHNLLADDPQFRALVYFNRITGTFVRYEIGEFNRGVLVVDGSNVAWNGMVRTRGGAPELGHVDIVCRYLREHYGVADIRVYFDANILDDVHDIERMSELKQHYHVERMSPGTPADGAIIEAAHELNCLLVSNDRYREYRKPPGTRTTPRAVGMKGMPRRARKRALARRVGVVVREGTPVFDPLVEELVARPQSLSEE
ncbi:MAG: NYN domain-containing protein [bacterium]